MRSLSALITTFAMPLVSDRSIARATHSMGMVPTLSLWPAARASFSAEAHAPELGVRKHGIGQDTPFDAAIHAVDQMS